ncbi:S-layer homology domain-containing protein [Paenibacillus psychroresistens]|nr:S-layer homology domain-containing protein [Paenibacillus psychroresistens]
MIDLVKKSLKGKFILSLLSLLLLVQTVGILTFSNTASANSTVNESEITGTSAYLQQLAGNPTDWTAFALGRAGKSVKAAYLDQLEAQVKQKKGIFSSATDAERLVLTIKAVGLDPTHFAGYDLVQSVYSNSDLAKSGSMGVIYGLLALDSGTYTIPATAVNTQTSLIQWLLDHQEAAKGWAYVTDEASSIDVTAMALTAFAPYYAKNEAVKKATDQALSWLSSQQKPSGAFNEFGENSESVSQVIIALTSLGIDPAGPTFTKTKNVINALSSYRQKDGGYAHTVGTPSNAMSSEQALQALVASQLFTDKKGTLYNNIKAAAEINITIEGPHGSVTEGIVKAADVLEGLQKLAAQQNVPVEIVDSTYGKYVSSIQNIKSAGNDGWAYAVQRNHGWIYPQVGMAEFQLLPNDQVAIYYGGSTQLIHQIKITPTQPKVGQAFTVTVEQSTWDWTANKETASAAAGVDVQVGAQKQTTNEQGIASFIGENTTGPIKAVITGYKADAAPSVVKSTYSFQIASDHVNVRVNIEGPQKPIATGVVSAVYAIDALQQVALLNNIPLEITDSAYGKYLSAVGDTSADKNDGWMFEVLRGNIWIYPDLGIGQFELKPNDQIYIYYGFAAQLVQSVNFIPEQPKAGKAFKIAVTQETWDWDKNQRAAKPGAGLTVELNGKTYVTETDGTLNIPAGLTNGSYNVVVTGYQNQASPNVLRFVQPLQIYADYDKAASWAQPFIVQSSKLGLLQGTGIEGFSPTKQVTRAEMAATLVRILGLPIPKQTTNTFTDVAADSWYAGYIAAVKEQGIVSGIGNGTYAPDQKVTREQLALMLTRALKLNAPTDSVTAFRDADTAAKTSIPALIAVVEAELITGVDETHFNPLGLVTREMLAAVAVRAYQSIH